MAKKNNKRDNNNFRAVVESLSQAVIVSRDDVIQYLNSRANIFTGYSEFELSNLSVDEIIHPEDRSTYAKNHQAVISGLKKASELQSRILTKAGDVKWAIVHITPIEWSGVAALMTSFTDVTDIKQTETRLRQWQQDVRKYMELSTEALWYMEFDSPMDIRLAEEEQVDYFYNHLYLKQANDAYARMTGYIHGEDVVGFRLDEFMPADIVGNINSLKKFIRASYCLSDMETNEKYPSGDEGVFLNNTVGIVKEGFLVGVWGTARDVTEIRASEKQLIEERRRYRTVADFTYDWEYWELPDGSLAYVSPSCERITGYDAESFVENPNLLMEIVVPEDRKILMDHHHALSKGDEVRNISYRILRKNNELRWLERASILVSGGRDEFLGVRVSNRDITDRRQAEREAKKHREDLAHVLRVATMGELAASLAHELNQPLTSILANAQAALRFLNSDMPDLDEIREILSDIAIDDKRAGEVIHRLRRLLQYGKLEFSSLYINEVILEVLPLLKSDAIIKRVHIETDLDYGLPPVEGDRIQLQQVLLNFIRNGSDAMKDIDGNDRRLIISSKRHDELDIFVAVRDHGVGLNNVDVGRLFTAFYSTKNDGMGMGLSINQSIIHAHGGRTWAQNNDGKGATFCFTLPIIQRPDGS